MINLAVENVFTKVTGPALECIPIDKALRFQVPGWQIIKRKMGPKGRNWDGSKSFYDYKNRAFLSGLLPKVINALRVAQVPFQVYDQRVKPDKVVRPVSPGILDGIILRDYQVKAVDELAKIGRGVAQLLWGTGPEASSRPVK
jgi:hypothetical protein